MYCLVILCSAGLIKLMSKQQELLASKLGPDLSWEEPQHPSVAIAAAVIPNPAALAAVGNAWWEPCGAA